MTPALMSTGRERVKKVQLLSKVPLGGHRGFVAAHGKPSDVTVINTTEHV